MIHHKGLGRTRIDISISVGLVRIHTSGETLRAVVANVEEIPGPDGTHRVPGGTVRLGNSMPFAACKNAFPPRVHPSRTLALQNIEETPGSHGRGRLQTRSLQEGGREVGQADKVVYRAACRHFRTPADGQRNVGSIPINVRFGPGERKTIVTGDHHEGVIQFAGVFQDAEHASQLGIEPFDFERIIEQVAADLRRIGKPCGKANIFQPLPCPHARPCLVRPVRFMPTIPETKGLTRLAGGEEVIEIADVVELRNIFVRQLGGPLVEFGTGWIPGPSAGAEITWIPPLAGETDTVARALQDIRVNIDFGRKSAPEIATLFEAGEPLSRENGAP